MESLEIPHYSWEVYLYSGETSLNIVGTSLYSWEILGDFPYIKGSFPEK